MPFTYKTEIMDAQDCLKAAFTSQTSQASWQFVSGFALRKGDSESLVVTLRHTAKAQQHKQFNPVATLG